MKRMKIIAPSASTSFLILPSLSFFYSFRSSKSTISSYSPWHLPLAVFLSFVSRMSCTLKQPKLLFYLLLILLKMTTGSLGVRVYEVKVPKPGIVGQPAKLECLWESGEKDFYSVRWYMNNEQFYSFILGNIPEKVNHKLPGINVDLAYSNQNVVTLSELSPASEGIYRCELMSEAPFFQTSFAAANLTVVNLPNEPEINGFRLKYRVGDMLNVTCTARNARPPARLSFHVNDKKMHHDSGRVRDLGVVESSPRGTYTSTSQLILPLSYRHAPSLSLTCRAHILNLKEETSLTAQVDPARTTMLSFFNTGVVRCVPLPQALLVASLSLLLSFYVPW